MSNDETKVCTKCGQRRFLSGFSKAKGKGDICRMCSGNGRPMKRLLGQTRILDETGSDLD